MLPNTDEIRQDMTKAAFKYVNEEFSTFTKTQQENIVNIFCNGYMAGMGFGTREWSKYYEETISKLMKGL